MRLTGSNPDGYEVVVSIPGLTEVTVVGVERVGRSIGIFDDDGWTDEPTVADAVVTDRYITLTSGVDPSDAEAMLRLSNVIARRATLEINTVHVATNPSDLTPEQTQIGEPYSVFDRLGGDDVERYQGCTRHDRPDCVCDEA